MAGLADCHSISDLKDRAKRRLPRAVFDFIEGGAEDEVSMRANESGFGHYELIPRTLVDVSRVNLATEVMGQRIELPLILSPTGLSRTFHFQGERAVAPAAARMGTIYSLSTASSVSIEDIGALTDGPKWFQIYVWRDRDLVKDLIERARGAGYHALCLTVDVQMMGKRERDLRNGLSVQPKLTPRLLLDAARRPGWWFNLLRSPPLQMANVVGKIPGADDGLSTAAQFVDSQFDRSVTWDDAEWMIRQWNGPFAIKGILTAEDARRCVDIGATGVIVSNHGGRQLDHVPAPIEVLPEIVDAVDGRADVILDGGVRRGSDILKALALGAKACMAGRPYLYGLAAGGEAGVDRALAVLRDEVERNLILMGVPDVAELGPRHVRRIEERGGFPSNR